MRKTRIAKQASVLFLIDGVGALVSAFFLGVVLVHYQSIIGMPSNVLLLLATIAVFFALYSLSCYYFSPINWRRFMRGIAIANLIYCCLTGCMVLLFADMLTHLGIAYFFIEILIIIALARYELKMTRML